MEVESLALLRLEPTLHFSALVGAVVVHDQVHFLIRRQILLEVIQEPNKLSAAVPILACANDFAVQDVERRKQGSCAMALVVVRLTLRKGEAVEVLCMAVEDLC